MKKLLLIILVLITVTGYAQMPERFISMQFNGGYSFTQSLPVVGIEVGARLHNFYVGIEGIAHASNRAAMPAIVALSAGYNIGSFKPFLSYGYQTAGNEAKDIFKPSFKPGVGITYYFASLPILITGQVQGKQILLTGGFNINF